MCYVNAYCHNSRLIPQSKTIPSFSCSTDTDAAQIHFKICVSLKLILASTDKQRKKDIQHCMRQDWNEDVQIFRWEASCGTCFAAEKGRHKLLQLDSSIIPCRQTIYNTQRFVWIWMHCTALHCTALHCTAKANPVLYSLFLHTQEYSCMSKMPPVRKDPKY